MPSVDGSGATTGQGSTEIRSAITCGLNCVYMPYLGFYCTLRGLYGKNFKNPFSTILGLQMSRDEHTGSLGCSVSALQPVLEGVVELPNLLIKV